MKIKAPRMKSWHWLCDMILIFFQDCCCLQVQAWTTLHCCCQGEIQTRSKIISISIQLPKNIFQVVNRYFIIGWPRPSPSGTDRCWPQAARGLPCPASPQPTKKTTTNIQDSSPNPNLIHSSSFYHQRSPTCYRLPWLRQRPTCWPQPSPTEWTVTFSGLPWLKLARTPLPPPSPLPTPTFSLPHSQTPLPTCSLLLSPTPRLACLELLSPGELPGSSWSPRSPGATSVKTVMMIFVAFRSREDTLATALTAAKPNLLKVALTKATPELLATALEVSSELGFPTNWKRQRCKKKEKLRKVGPKGRDCPKCSTSSELKND